MKTRIAIIIVTLFALHTASWAVRTRVYDNSVATCATKRDRPAKGDDTFAIGGKTFSANGVSHSLNVLACDREMGGTPSFVSLP